MYLAHGFAGAMLATIGVSSQTMPEPWRFIALASVTVAVAAASWRFYEAPINRLKASLGACEKRSSGKRWRLIVPGCRVPEVLVREGLSAE